MVAAAFAALRPVLRARAVAQLAARRLLHGLVARALQVVVGLGVVLLQAMDLGLKPLEVLLGVEELLLKLNL